ncbi:hypothetical protein KOW79_002178 [Hemibagrus wyckioides]|uniref:Uncharacterized protein n=1 Tax=Hemibagrus wyckioides TaxID=337641 RepID=A0A9D3SQQ2_9TELE|nr:hypothetical protein KOW79_002178 [Hemibagrus wyckioides]
MGRRRPSDEEEIEDGGRPSDETKSPWEQWQGCNFWIQGRCEGLQQQVEDLFALVPALSSRREDMEGDFTTI